LAGIGILIDEDDAVLFGVTVAQSEAELAPREQPRGS
jgi:hypothetical protein